LGLFVVLSLGTITPSVVNGLFESAYAEFGKATESSNGNTFGFSYPHALDQRVGEK